MGPGEVAAILFGVFAVLVVLRVPVAFALGLAVVPVFFIDDRLTPVLLLREMFKSYNAFVLLAVPFFLHGPVDQQLVIPGPLHFLAGESFWWKFTF